VSDFQIETSWKSDGQTYAFAIKVNSENYEEKIDDLAEAIKRTIRAAKKKQK
jgi:predicted AlkP superfamily phosphohydrolase/phosphomutase